MPNAGDCIAGRYRLEYPLGEGGMGSVWRARHLELDAPIAVKFQHAHRARSGGAAERFRKEARAAARLKSPNVVRVVDFGIDGDVPYFAMELLEGESLRARLERQVSSPLAEVLEVMRQAASALDAAHAAGIVHRDFKPSNLFLVKSDEGDVVKLLDFGIAKWVEAEASAEGASTDDNLVVGSAQYMSPEQARGEAVDPRSDVWSLAVVAYQMLTGVIPFQGANIPDALRRICSGRFELPSRALSADYAAFDAVFSRAFELDADLRFETAGEFSNALTAAGQTLVGTNPRRVFPSPSSGGWAFGRDGATLSVPLQPARRSARWGRRPRALLAAALGLLMALVVLVARTQSSAPAAVSITTSVSAPRAASARPVSAVQEPNTGMSPRLSVTGSTTTLSRSRAPARPLRAAAATHHLPAVAVGVTQPPASALPVDPSPAPTAAARAETPTHLDPVFGLEVPALR